MVVTLARRGYHATSLSYGGMINVDEGWAKIKGAVEEGKLGSSARVATAKPNPLAGKSKAHITCVYIYDWTDEEDVRRIREELRKLGITHKTPYKTVAIVPYT